MTNLHRKKQAVVQTSHKIKQPYTNPNLKQMSWKTFLRVKHQAVTCKFCGKKNSQSYVCQECLDYFVEQRKKRMKAKREAM